MKKLKILALALLSLIILVGVIKNVQSSRAEKRYAEQQARIAADEALDLQYSKLPQPRLDIHAIKQLPSGGSYMGSSFRPSFLKRVAEAGRLPVIVSLPGCGFGVSGADLLENVAMLSILENPPLLNRKSFFQACKDRDRDMVSSIMREHLEFVSAYIARSDWIDKDRVLLSGYGEGGPIVIASSMSAKRIAIGDSCLIGWPKTISDQRSTVLLTVDTNGLMRDASPTRPVDVKDVQARGVSSLVVAKPCPGLERPQVHLPAKEIVTAGRIDMLSLPLPLRKARKAIYDQL
ncbi:hypothetical protein ACWIGM_05105 [Bosea sp. NPDC055332]